MPEFCEVCERAAREAGAVLQEWRGRFAVREKGPADLVTEADLAAQKKIRGLITEKFPGHLFMGEEDDGAQQPADDSPYRWVVDPLDGTTNYVHGLPHYAVSIALEYEETPVVAGIYDPVKDEYFHASRGGGAFLGDEPIRASGVATLEQAVFAAGFAPNVQPGSPEIERFLRVLYASQSVRRLGSAALNLAYVACGRLDGYWAMSVKRWDVAAGCLLVSEAEGVLTDIGGGPVNLARPQLLAAGSAALHEATRELF
ncbi:MAG: inositol monophosphatase [Planctomycetales bacterium]|nr:inositol monophosphatase [Planctomycetales bacterium]